MQNRGSWRSSGTSSPRRPTGSSHMASHIEHPSPTSAPPSTGSLVRALRPPRTHPELLPAGVHFHQGAGSLTALSQRSTWNTTRSLSPAPWLGHGDPATGPWAAASSSPSSTRRANTATASRTFGVEARSSWPQGTAHWSGIGGKAQLDCGAPGSAAPQHETRRTHPRTFLEHPRSLVRGPGPPGWCPELDVATPPCVPRGTCECPGQQPAHLRPTLDLDIRQGFEMGAAPTPGRNQAAP